MKKLLSILLVLAMLLAFTACQKAETAPAEPETEVSAPAEAPEAETAAPAEEPEAEAAEEPQEEPAEEPQEEAPAEAEPYVYELPLTTDDITYSIYLNFPPYLGSYIESFSQQSCYIEWQERTGIKLEFYEASDRSAMSTQISLMAASGDFYDLISNMGGYYSGGLVKAISDEIILDLADLCEEYAPCYMSVVNTDEAHRKSVYDDDGQMGAIVTFNNILENGNGAIIRQDWLDDLGLSTPETLGDWHDVLTAFKSNYDISDPLFLVASGQNGTNLAGCFGTAGMSNLYHEDGVVKSGLLDDGFKEYLQMMNQWYNEGLVNNDFFSRSDELRDSGVEPAVLNGQCGIYYSPANTIADYVNQNVDPNAKLVALAEPTADDGTTNEFNTYPSYVGMNSMSISATCPQPELAVQFLDYLYSEEGQLLCNYGIEGEAFEYDENGEAQWTDLVVNNPEIPMVPFCRNLYTLLDMPSLYVLERTWASYNQEQIDALLTTWNYGYSKSLPALSLTTEENEIYNGYITDIDTYVEEQVVKFIIGEVSFDQWETFTSTVEQMHIQDCIDVYQTAFDRYNSR